jgi:hypothetical protein
LVQHFNALGLPRAIPIYWIVTLIINLVLVFALVALHFHTSTGRSFSEVFVLGSLRG